MDPDFWEDEARALLRVIFPLISSAAEDAAIKALEHVAAEADVSWEMINLAVQELAKEMTFDLVRGITANTMKMLRAKLETWVVEGLPLEALADELVPIFGGTRAAGIAVTEVTRVFAMGNLEAWRKSGIVKSIAWETAEDSLVCPICGPLGDMDPQPIDNPNFRGNPHPPAHPRCRCWLRPVVTG